MNPWIELTVVLNCRKFAASERNGTQLMVGVNSRVKELYKSIDPELWKELRHNPIFC